MKTTNYVITAIAIVMASVLLQSCAKVWCIEGEGEREEFNVNIDDFEGVKLEIDADVFITRGSDYELIVSAQENIFDNLDFDIDRGILKIKQDECTWNHSNIDIYITMPEVEYVGIAGSGDITSTSVFKTDEIELEILGSGDIDFAVESDDIHSVISGSGDIRLEGYTDDHRVHISGSGSVEAFNMETDDCDITINGSGDCEVWVEDYLKVLINGSGNVYYYGLPELEISINGSGNIVHEGAK
jgi:hypothetical protein